MTKAPSIKKLQAEVDRFNRAYPTGTRVILKNDLGIETETRVRHPAQILDGHSAVAWFDGVSGVYSIIGRVRLAT